MLRLNTCLLAASLLTACGTDVNPLPPADDAAVAARDAAVLPGDDAGAASADAGVPTADAGDTTSDAGTIVAPDAGSASLSCGYPDEVLDAVTSTCLGVTRDVDLMLWSDVCAARGGHELEWRTLEEQARLQTIIPTSALTGLRHRSDGTWVWTSDDSAALVTWSTPPMVGHTNARLTPTGATGTFTHTGSGFCVRPADAS